MNTPAGTNLANLMGMAGTAERASNNEEAISYYNRVLEADPGFSEAWLGKGRAAGWLSSIAAPRLNEALVAFGHAIGSADEESKANIAQRANVDMIAICNAVYVMTRRHYNDHRNVAGVTDTYVKVAASVLDALRAAQPWQPSNRESSEAIIRISRELLDTGVTPDFAALLTNWIVIETERLQAIDPSYVPPVAAAQTQADKDKADADFQALGYIVLFVVVVLGAIITAASR